MRNHIKESGYTVLELLEQLQQVVSLESGAGRRIFVGPVDGDDGRKPRATPIIGIEVNTDPESPEFDVCWLYPGEDEWE